MIKRTIIILLYLFLAFTILVSGKTIEKVNLTDIMKPENIAVDDNQLYISEGGSVFIFSLSDYKLVKKFGSKGSGPQEFQLPGQMKLIVDARTDKIIINSLNKISFFSKQGEFINEIRSQSFAYLVRPLGDSLVGLGSAADSKAYYTVINLYDSKFAKTKELFRVVNDVVSPTRKGYKLVNQTIFFDTHKDKLFFTGNSDSAIDIYDQSIKKIGSIQVNVKKKKVSQEFKDMLLNFIKTNPETKDRFEQMKPITFADYFPTILNLYVEDDVVYIITSNIDFKKGTMEVLTYDWKGKLKKKFNVLLKQEAPLRTYPMAIHKGKIYQVVENAEEETWQLEVSELK